MKKSIFFVLLILIFAVSMFISCATTPKDGEPGTLGYVSAARQRAVDFESPDYFPSEWEKQEDQYNVVSKEPKKKPADYNALAESYDELFKKAVPLYAQAKEDELMEARGHIVNSGFSQYFPEYLKKADDTALTAKQQYEAEEYYEAKSTAGKAKAQYDEMLAGTKVYLARQEVIDRGFVKYDSENFAKADEIVKSAIKDYEAENKIAAFEKAEEAHLRYNIILSNGWTAYASDRRTTASRERDRAISERANIAARDTFRNAEVLFNHAGDFFKAGKNDEAAVAFTEAEALYAVSRKETEEKRIRAEEAIKTANEKVGTSSETAMEAERIIEGGSR